MPFLPDVEVDPEWILAGLLPPLLYSASVSMPSMNFRREFGAIGALSVVLVVVSAVLLGLLFWWLIPGLDLWWGIALGAIVSPTDAVATAIVKSTGVSSRIVSILDGEGLLNDASALVVLRTAIAATAASVSAWGVVGDFAFAVGVAAAIGYVVGKLNLAVRSRLTDPTVNTVLSFTVPFVASLPAEHLGASGLVAAVVAGLVTGHGTPRALAPAHRISDAQNWKSVELILEGAIFLLMGLQMHALVLDVFGQDDLGLLHAIAIAVAALVGTLVVRTGFVAPLLWQLDRRGKRRERLRPRLEHVQERLDGKAAEHEGDDPHAARIRLDAADGGDPPTSRGRSREISPARLDRFRTRVRRSLADVDYYLAAPLTWRDGGVVVWAGMRGAITVAAAQTLPPETPHRSFLVLVAFLVAGFSLLVQGGTLRAFVRVIRPTGGPDRASRDQERAALVDLMRDAVERADLPTDRDGRMGVDARLAAIEAKRKALLDARRRPVRRERTLCRTRHARCGSAQHRDACGRSRLRIAAAEHVAAAGHVITAGNTAAPGAMLPGPCHDAVDRAADRSGRAAPLLGESPQIVAEPLDARGALRVLRRARDALLQLAEPGTEHLIHCHRPRLSDDVFEVLAVRGAGGEGLDDSFVDATSQPEGREIVALVVAAVRRTSRAAGGTCVRPLQHGCLRGLLARDGRHLGPCDVEEQLPIERLVMANGAHDEFVRDPHADGCGDEEETLLDQGLGIASQRVRDHRLAVAPPFPDHHSPVPRFHDPKVRSADFTVVTRRRRTFRGCNSLLERVAPEGSRHACCDGIGGACGPHVAGTRRARDGRRVRPSVPRSCRRGRRDQSWTTGSVRPEASERVAASAIACAARPSRSVAPTGDPVSSASTNERSAAA
nr:sodium:proton antiporter [Pseudoclavibacter chungangensis]